MKNVWRNIIGDDVMMMQSLLLGSVGSGHRNVIGGFPQLWQWVGGVHLLGNS